MKYQKEYSYLHALRLGEEAIFDNSDQKNFDPSFRDKYKQFSNVVNFLNMSATGNRRYSVAAKGNGDKVAIRCIQDGDNHSDVPRTYNRVKRAAKKATTKPDNLRTLVAEAVAAQLQKAKGPRNMWRLIITDTNFPLAVFDTDEDAHQSRLLSNIKGTRLVKVKEVME